MPLDLPGLSGLTVALDTEASGLHVDDGARVSIVSLAWEDEEGDIETMVLPFDQGLLDKDVPGWAADLFETDINYGPDEWDELVDWLQQQWLVYHNCKYDLHIMAAGHRKWGRGVDLSSRTLYDTQVTNLIFFPNESTSLKPTAARLWGEEERESERRLQRWLSKHKVNDQPRYDLAPWELIGPYAGNDARQTLQLRNHHMAMVESGEVQCPWHLIDQEVDLALCLFRVERRGMGFDVERAREAADLLRKESTKLKVQLRKRWRREVTPHAARWWFYDHLGVKPPKGEPSADIESIQALVAQGVECAEEYQQYAQYQSALSKWYDNWPNLVGPDGRLRASFRQAKAEGMQGKGGGTISGRLSVERVQLQAIPHDFRLPPGVPGVRSLFIAKPGHELWEVDISQAEVRVATWAAKCVPMLEVLQAGDDVHGQTAMRVFDIDRSHPEWGKHRTLAKRLTFGTLYGFGAPTFRSTLLSEGFDVPLSQCKEWLNEYREAFPEFRKLYYQAQEQVRRRGFVVTGSGRKRWFSDFERRFKAEKAFNQIIQGSVAEAMKQIKVEVEVNYPGFLVNEIHDSLILEVPEGDEGRAMVKPVEDLMLTILEDMYGSWDEDHVIPWKVDAKRWAS